MRSGCCRGVDVKCALHVVDLIATCLPHNRPYMHIDAVHVCDVNIFDMGLLFVDSSWYSRQPVVFHSTIFRKDKSFHTPAFRQVLDTVKDITSFTQEERQIFATLQENEQILTVSLVLFHFDCMGLVNKL